jgi:ABC-type uncharacterized transport system auxiliary subunit
MKTSLALLIGVSTFSLAACTFLPKPGIETRYTLQPIASAGQGANTATAMPVNPSLTIRVARPEVPLAYRGDQLALTKDGEQTFYAGKSWEAPVPDLLQSALVRDLSTLLPTWVISTETSGLRSTYELQTAVHTFATIQSGNTSTLAIDLEIRLLNPATREVITVLPFHYREPLASPLTTQQTLAAYQKAWQTLLPAITRAIPQPQ